MIRSRDIRAAEATAARLRSERAARIAGGGLVSVPIDEEDRFFYVSPATHISILKDIAHVGALDWEQLTGGRGPLTLAGESLNRMVEQICKGLGFGNPEELEAEEQGQRREREYHAYFAAGQPNGASEAGFRRWLRERG